MKLSDANALWLMDTLTQHQHPDPEGLVARIEHANASNITGISKENAAAVGIRNVDEPLMSLFAATQHDTQTNKRYRISDSSRAAVSSRIESALLAGTAPQNPFLDKDGFLLLTKPVREEKPVDDKQMLDHIYTVMEEYL